VEWQAFLKTGLERFKPSCLERTECQPPPTSKTSGIERVQALADIVHSRNVVKATTKPVHRLQIRPIVHNWEALPTIPPSYIRVRAYSSVGMWRETDRQTHIQTHRNRQTHRCASPIYISRRLRLTRNVIRGKRGITKRCC